MPRTDTLRFQDGQAAIRYDARGFPRRRSASRARNLENAHVRRRISLANIARFFVDRRDPRMILRSENVSVRLMTSSIGEPSGPSGIASASSMHKIRAVWRRKFRGLFEGTILRLPPGNWRLRTVLRGLAALAGPRLIAEDPRERG